MWRNVTSDSSTTGFVHSGPRVNEIVGRKVAVVNVSLEMVVGLGDAGGRADGEADGSDAPQATAPTRTAPVRLLDAIFRNCVTVRMPVSLVAAT
jgi:hypothetical protein